MRDKLIAAITFSKRVGKLVQGFDLVKTAMQTGEAEVILLAKDLSEKTKKEMEYLAREMEVPLYVTEFTLDEFWYLVQKRAGVIAVTDPGFAQKIETLLQMDISAQQIENTENRAN